jgi:hypothetical protein
MYRFNLFIAKITVKDLDMVKGMQSTKQIKVYLGQVLILIKKMIKIA